MKFYYICADKGDTCVYATANGSCCVTACTMEPRLKTNADHIRSMTDEEMETELLPLFEELCEDGIPSPEYMRFWLKQPYKEDA